MDYQTCRVGDQDVYVGKLPTTSEELSSMRRVTSIIRDIYFFEEEGESRKKVVYNDESLRSEKSGLGIEVGHLATREEGIFSVVGFNGVSAILKKLEIGPESIARGVGRTVTSYVQGLQVYGFWIPTFTKERRIL